MIEDSWDVLCPNKSRTASWMNSVSSVLSANSQVFESGFELLKQPGWWALKTIVPPRPYSMLTGISESLLKKKRKLSASSSSQSSQPYAPPPPPPPPPPTLPLTKTEETDAVIDIETEAKVDDEVKAGEASSTLASLENKNLVIPDPTVMSRSPMTVETAHTLLFARHYAERVPNVNALLPLEQEATPSTVKAAQEIKRKLVERLLKVDSRLLQEALATSQMTAPFLAAAGKGISRTVTTKIAPNISTANPSVPASSVPAKTSPKVTKEVKKNQKPAKPPNYVRASPHENELLETCIRVANPDAIMLRFKRKLILRRTKRRLGLPVLDIDAFMYKYLKSPAPLRLKSETECLSTSTDDKSDPNRSAKGASEAPKTFFDVPFHRDPSLSFRAKLLGLSNVCENYPLEIISPFTGLRLPAFIYREYKRKPIKMQLLEEIQAVVPVFDPDPDPDLDLDLDPDPESKVKDRDKDDVEDDKEGSNGVKDDNPDESSIDFIHVRKEWIPQLNRLLRRFFWTGIDMTECLDYPDYGVLVMYKKLLIGCAILTPDSYLAYFFIHPEWSGNGLGSRLLYLLITKIAPKHMDITLHVSVTNPALLLYQRFGFKPEEYIVNFYDKYFKDLSSNEGLLHTYSKNAFFIRYRR